MLCVTDLFVWCVCFHCFVDQTDFTRTGKRTMRGVIQDGVNSVMRYYKNNFTDGTRQVQAKTHLHND